MKLIYSGVMTGKSSPTGTNGFIDALREVFDVVEDVPAVKLNSVREADIVFLQPQDKGISRETLQHLKAIGAYVINWTGDARDNTPAYCWEYAQVVDINCFTNMRDVYNMKEAGYASEFLQIGYDPAIYYPDASITKDIDIVFMGNNYGHFPMSSMRIEMVRELKRVYGDRFKAYGIGQPDGNFMGNQQGEADIYRRTKIGINLSHYNYERYTSDRMFRMLGSGMAVLSHRYDGIEEDFERGAHLATWTDIPMLISQINQHLNTPEWLDILSRQGHLLSLKRDTFLEMAKNIKKLYEQHR